MQKWQISQRTSSVRKSVRRYTKIWPTTLLILVALSGSSDAYAATDWLQYIASYGDLIEAFGPNPTAGEQHYLQYGRAEGRVLDDFNEVQYLANYPDLQAAFGTDTDAATVHYIEHGYFEGRTDLNLKPHKVIDVARESGVPSPIPSNGDSVVFDYNGDGLPDILLSAHGQEWPLLRQGPPGRFTRVLPGTFAKGLDRHGCTSGDFNHDGRPDIYCVRGACEGICTKPYPDELYLERSDRTFAKITDALGASDEHGRGRDAKPLDYDRDGVIDLVIANETSTAFPEEGNHLFHNDGSKFVDVLGSPLRHTIGTFRVTAVPKPDGYPDVAMRTSIGVLYYPNDRGTFRPGRQLGGASSWDVEAADLSGDGLSDLVIVRQGTLEVRLNDGSFTFGRISYKTSLTQGRDVALCQLDGRRGIDIYVVQGVRPANQDIVLLNDETGASYTRLATPRVATGHGDVGTCVPRFAGALGDAVLVTDNKWISAGDPDLGPTRLMILRP